MEDESKNPHWMLFVISPNGMQTPVNRIHVASGRRRVVEAVMIP